VVTTSWTPSGMTLYGSIMLHPQSAHGPRARVQEENSRSCIVHQDVQPLLLLQELLCGCLGKFRCRQVQFQKLNLAVPWGKSSRFDALDGVQTFLSIPCSEVNLGTITGQSLYGF